MCSSGQNKNTHSQRAVSSRYITYYLCTRAALDKTEKGYKHG